MNTAHLIALQANLANEQDRLSNANTMEERKLRQVWVAQLEKEIADEKKFLGMDDLTGVEMSDSELLAGLGL